jgi:ribosomal protein S18 acetylase RimI-like enzyme
MDVKSRSQEKVAYQTAARLHCDFITEGFLATLGVPFLTLLYRSIDNDNDSVFLVEEVDGEIVGFVTGASGLGRIYRALLLQPHRLLFALKECFISPLKIYKIIEILVFSIKNRSLIQLPKEELLSIVVHGDYHGNGIAEKLFRSLCAQFASKGAERFKITVGGDLERAHAFYKKMGCTPFVELQVHAGVTSIVYIKELGA